MALDQKYLADPNVICGKILRHENSGNTKSNRLWTYRNDHGEECLAGDKYSCKRQAYKDLRLCRVDVLIIYTANMDIHTLEFSDTFQPHEIAPLIRQVKNLRQHEDKYRSLYDEACKERDELKSKLQNIQKLLGSK